MLQQYPCNTFLTTLLNQYYIFFVTFLHTDHNIKVCTFNLFPLQNMNMMHSFRSLETRIKPKSHITVTRLFLFFETCTKSLTFSNLHTWIKITVLNYTLSLIIITDIFFTDIIIHAKVFSVKVMSVIIITDEVVHASIR